MTDEIDDTVKGDGVITVPVSEQKDDDMDPSQIDLSPNVANSLITESAGNIQASNRNSRGVFDAVMGAIAGTVQTNFAEIGAVESRAVSGVMGTPVAGPATQTP